MWRTKGSLIPLPDDDKDKVKIGSQNSNLTGLLKQGVYQGNWSANSREQLIRRIKKCISEMDMDIVIKMFDNLEGKIQKAHEYGLDSLL